MGNRKNRKDTSIAKFSLSEVGKNLPQNKEEKVNDLSESLKKAFGKENIADLTNEGNSAIKEVLKSFSSKNRKSDAETQQIIADTLNSFQDLETKASNTHKTEMEINNINEDAYRKKLENYILKRLINYIDEVGIDVVIEKHPELIKIILTKN